MYSVAFFSQKITLKVLGFDTNTPIEKARFFINKTTYPNEKGALSFSITHLNYQTKQVVFEEGVSPLIIFLKER